MKHQSDIAIIGTHQWRASDQQGTEPSRCRPSLYGAYRSTTWLDAVSDVIAAFFVHKYGFPGFSTCGVHRIHYAAVRCRCGVTA